MKRTLLSKVPLPIRLTLTDQAADCIRQALHGNRWQGVLPAEAELCRELGVSRGTLRSALAVLFAENLLSPGGRGGRHAIVATAGGRKRKLHALSGNLVRVLSPQPRFIIAGQTQIIFQTISEALGRAGLHFEFEHHPGIWDLRHPDLRLRKITSQPNTVGWVLYRSTQAVQEWFAASGLPAVVIGGIFPGIALSHAEFDLVAASRHAAGIFASRGYRRMVFLTVEKATAGDQASARAFLEAATVAGADAQLAIFDDTVPGLCRLLDSLLLSNPQPTAFLAAFSNHVHAIIGHLTRRGFPVPQAAAVISRMDAVLLGESIPTVARYQMDAERLGRGLARLLLKALNPAIKTTIGRCIIMPEFVDGETAGGTVDQ
ncbi:MAG: substrate-binding domain-containing protein [Verrucomicrobia bacterium]|nr:substrate-binding domain-containing protein [Verrucomicrobiota bacterium]